MPPVRCYLRYCIPVFFLLFTISSRAQVHTPSDTAFADSSTATLVLGTINIIGNKVTKERIIYRELMFRTGDTLTFSDLTKKIKRTEENLENTSLFNSVNITWLRENEKVNLYIIVAERWYVFPLPIFEIAERNFNAWWETKDFSRIVYGGVLNWNNFRGRNEVLAVSARLGYTQRLSFYYSIPYINRNQKSGLTFGYAYSRNHQSSVKTVENKIVNYKDEELFSKKEYGGSIAYSYRKNLYETHQFEVGYRHSSVLDTVVRLNPFYFAPNENAINYSIIRYFFKSDHRDIVVYPKRGYYFDIELVKNGLPGLGDDIDIWYTTIHLKNFWPLSKKFFFGTGISAKLTADTYVPYYLQRGLGYGRDYIRGYELYVMDGVNFFLLKTNLKYELLRKREIHLDFIPLNKFATIPYAFYINLYSDAGITKDKQFAAENPLSRSWQYGYGAGLDFVTYYDMVFRFEYSFNKLGESGFFLHFTAPI
jgi:outer membrane protein assembly factor BamA